MILRKSLGCHIVGAVSVAWYLHRLANMGPCEVLYRVGEQTKRMLSRHSTYGWAAFPPAKISFFPDLREALISNTTAALFDATEAAAKALLAGNFKAHGIAWPRRDPADLFPNDVWRLDPVSG